MLSKKKVKGKWQYLMLKATDTGSITGNTKQPQQMCPGLHYKGRNKI